MCACGDKLKKPHESKINSERQGDVQPAGAVIESVQVVVRGPDREPVMRRVRALGADLLHSSPFHSETFSYSTAHKQTRHG